MKTMELTEKQNQIVHC